MAKLTLYDVDNVEELEWPDLDHEITMDSPALGIFTDFKEVKPLVIEGDTTAIDAQKLMQKAHVRLKVVVDGDTRFLGIVSFKELNSQEVIKRVSQGARRQELSVMDFMKPKNNLKAFAYSELEKATIKDVVDALKDNGQQHCMVIDHDQDRIRGVISASDIARKLRISLDITRDSSFVGIYNAIRF